MEDVKRLTHDIENWYIVSLVQAMYGAISANVRAVKISEATEQSVTFHFLIERENEADREEFDDILFEFQALQDQMVDCKLEVTVGSDSQPLIALPGRCVYARKED